MGVQSSVGQDFPVSEYYRGQIQDAITISRTGTWWTAVLLILDPKTKLKFVGVYKWQKTSNGWKVRNKLNVRSANDSVKLSRALADMGRLL